MRTLRVLGVLVVVGVAGTLAAPASARRGPAAAEAAAIRAAVTAYVARPGAPARSARIEKVFVSTVDARYALARLDVGLPVTGRAILARRGGGWRVVSYGDSGFPFKGVPRPVLNDLLGATICDCRPR